MDHCPLVGRVVNQQVIELRARDLPGDRALMMHGLEEIERPRLLTG